MEGSRWKHGTCLECELPEMGATVDDLRWRIPEASKMSEAVADRRYSKEASGNFCLEFARELVHGIRRERIGPGTLCERKRGIATVDSRARRVDDRRRSASGGAENVDQTADIDAMRFDPVPVATHDRRCRRQMEASVHAVRRGVDCGRNGDVAEHKLGR